MEYTKLGRTGLDVSQICLGCMSYGEGDQGNHAWSLGEEESRPFIKRALEAGINFFDRANRYSLGIRVAINTIHHAPATQSFLELPVLGRSRTGQCA